LVGADRTAERAREARDARRLEAACTVHIGAATRSAALAVDDHARADRGDPRERVLRGHLATADAGSLRRVTQDETSDNQLIARWRSRARSPMSMPVAVAT